jgi:hypothetical protein
MIWVDIFKLGAEVHRGGHVVEITESFANAVLRNFRRLAQEGAEVVVLREHEREGYVFGKVHALRMMDGWLQASMEFYLEDDRMAFNAGMLRRFSPGFALNFEHPHTGETIGPTLLEVSYTSMPYQHNLRPPQVTNPGVRLALNYAGEILTPYEEDEMNEESKAAETAEAVEPAEASADVSALDAIMDRLAAIEARFEEPVTEPAAAELSADEPDELAQLRAQVQKLEDDKVRMELAARGITEDVEHFVRLKRESPEVFEFAVKKAQVATVQEPIGRPGTESVDGELGVQALIEMAADQGATYGKGLSIWLARNYPERTDEVLAAARD